MRVASSTRRSTAGRVECVPASFLFFVETRVTKPSTLHVIGSRYYGPDRNSHPYLNLYPTQRLVRRIL